jgi:hypothetical protein
MGFKHRSNNDGRFSDAIWADLPEELPLDPAVGIYACDTFSNFGLTAAVASNVGRYASRVGVYKSYEDTGGAITQLATALGRLSINTAATDNNECWLQSNGGLGVLGKITSASPRKLWFEARVATSQIAAQNFFVGLTEEGLAAANTQADSGGAMADKDYVGFRVTEDAPSKVDIVFRKAGAGGEVEVLAEAHTLAAGTFVNLGFVFDPSVGTSQRIRFFVNGVKQGSYVTAAQVAGATFPNGEELSFLIGGKNNNADNTYLCEGWRFAQLF